MMKVWSIFLTSIFQVLFSHSFAYANGFYKELGFEFAIDKGFAGQGVRIAVLSTGLDFSRADLRDAVAVNSGEAQDKKNNGIDDDSNGWVDDFWGLDTFGVSAAPWDEQSNYTGSSIASILVGRKQGVFRKFRPLAPKSVIIPVKIFSEDGVVSFENIEKGMQYAFDRAANIIVLAASWKTRMRGSLCRKIQMASERGVLVVGMAGNSGEAVSEQLFPASCDSENLMVVGATDGTGRWSDFSNFGKGVQIGAPGKDVLTIAPNSSLNYRSGTAMAAAVVSSAAAVLLSHPHGLSAEQVCQVLVDSATPLIESSGKVESGVLNLKSAFDHPLLNIQPLQEGI